MTKVSKLGFGNRIFQIEAADLPAIWVWCKCLTTLYGQAKTGTEATAAY